MAGIYFVFTVPEAGDYNFYLTVTDPATCVSAQDRDDDDYSDTDFTAFKVAAKGTTHFIAKAIHPCDPLEYKFTSDSDPGYNPQWEVWDKPPGQQPLMTGTGPVFIYTFPALGVTYEVRLTTTDNDKSVQFDYRWKDESLHRQTLSK